VAGGTGAGAGGIGVVELLAAFWLVVFGAGLVFGFGDKELFEGLDWSGSGTNKGAVCGAFRNWVSFLGLVGLPLVELKSELKKELSFVRLLIVELLPELMNHAKSKNMPSSKSSFFIYFFLKTKISFLVTKHYNLKRFQI
jgi:hypothetical protein